MQIEECDDDDEKNDDGSTCGVGGKVGGEHALDVVAIVKNIFIEMVIITPTLR